MLVLYKGSMWFSGGNPAADYEVTVHHRASNQPALLFTDSTGTSPAANPLTTDEFGEVWFWAAPGYYVTHLSGEVFEYQVDVSFTDPVWPGLWVHTQFTPATVWQIAHHFGVSPHVEVLVDGQVVYATVEHPDDETTTISFGAPTAGVAHLRR